MHKQIRKRRVSILSLDDKMINEIFDNITFTNEKLIKIYFNAISIDFVTFLYTCIFEKTLITIDKTFKLKTLCDDEFEINFIAKRIYDEFQLFIDIEIP